MHKFIGVALLAGIGLLSAQTLEAQRIFPVSLEARGGATFPVDTFGDDLSPGLGFGFNASVRFAPFVSLYGGYSRMAFDVDAPPGVDADLVGSGIDAGVLLRASAPGVGVSPWLRGGAVFHQLEGTADFLGVVGGTGTSDRTTGFEVGAGVDLRVAPGLFLTPGVRYTQYPVRFDGEGNGDATYLMGDVGLRFRL